MQGWSLVEKQLDDTLSQLIFHPKENFVTISQRFTAQNLWRSLPDDMGSLPNAEGMYPDMVFVSVRQIETEPHTVSGGAGQ